MNVTVLNVYIAQIRKSEHYITDSTVWFQPLHSHILHFICSPTKQGRQLKHVLALALTVICSPVEKMSMLQHILP